MQGITENGIIRTIRRYIKLKKRKLLKQNRRPFLQIHLVEHCNLNCKSCAHFSPVAIPEQISVESLKDVYRQLQPGFEKFFSRLELMGGEPLLHPQIEEILSMTRVYFPTIEIRLVTNGIRLLNMSDSFFTCCATNEIVVYISMYPIGLDYVRIHAKLDHFQVSYNKYGEYEECKRFVKYELDPSGKGNARRNYSRCKLGGRCLQLRGDRLYPCFLSAYAYHLNQRFNTVFQWEQEDYIEVSRPILEKDFIHFINNSVPFCRYCDMKHEVFTTWGISKRTSEEWIKPK